MARGKKKETLTPEERLQAALVPESEQPYPVPGNWCWIHLLDSFYNYTDSKKKIPQKEYIKDGDIAVVDQGQDLVGGYTNDRELAFSGDLPVIIFGDHTRCIKYIDFPFAQGADGVKVLKPKPFFDAKAFYYAFQNVNIPNMGYRRHFPLFDQYTIPLPPLAEQQRIVDRIESLFAKLDEAKQKAQDALDSFETRKAAILHKAFTGELTAQWRKAHGVGIKSWEKKALGDITDILSSKRIYKEEYTANGIPFFRSSEVVDLYDTGNTEPTFFISEQRYEEIKNQYGVPDVGDLLVTSVGTIGKTWIVDNRKFYYKDGNLTQVRKSKLLDMRFLQFYIMSPEFKEQIEETVSGSAYNALTIVKFKKIRLPIPSVVEQSRIVRILDDLLAKEQQAKEAAEGVLEQIDLIKKAILARAFRGELGTNNPSEESAVKLLKTCYCGELQS